jgi:hypothetical protein
VWSSFEVVQASSTFQISVTGMAVFGGVLLHFKPWKFLVCNCYCNPGGIMGFALLNDENYDFFFD